MLFSPALYEVGFAALAGLPYLKHGLDLFLASVEHIVLGLWDLHVDHGDGNTGAGRFGVAERAKAIGKDYGLFLSADSIAAVD